MGQLAASEVFRQDGAVTGQTRRAAPEMRSRPPSVNRDAGPGRRVCPGVAAALALTTNSARKRHHIALNMPPVPRAPGRSGTARMANYERPRTQQFALESRPYRDLFAFTVKGFGALSLRHGGVVQVAGAGCRVVVSEWRAWEWLVRRAGVRGVSRPRWSQSRSPVALPGPSLWLRGPGGHRPAAGRRSRR